MMQHISSKFNNCLSDNVVPHSQSSTFGGYAIKQFIESLCCQELYTKAIILPAWNIIAYFTKFM